MVALDAISNAAKADNFDGHGWSLSYPLLRHLLQGAAERLVKMEEQGTSINGIAYAIDVARAVELPQIRIDAARTAFDESQARQKREKLAISAEERRKAKEEEVAARALAREEAEKRQAEQAQADADAAGARRGGKRKPQMEVLTSTNDEGGRDGEAGGHGSDRRKPALPDGARVVSTSSARLQRSNSLSRRSGSARGAGSNPLGGLAGARKGSPAKRVGAKGYPAAEVRPLHREVPLHFIPRAQLLKKIEQIAALNATAATPPRMVVSTEAKEVWQHRWDDKYNGGHPLGREAVFAVPPPAAPALASSPAAALPRS